MIVVLIGGSCDGRRIEWDGRAGPVIRVASLPRMDAFANYGWDQSELREVRYTAQHETYRIIQRFDDVAFAAPEGWDPHCAFRELARGYREERQRCN